DAEEFANGDPQVEEQYLDSMGSQEVYPLFGFTYNEVRRNVINLGLDLKGGMNVTLEVSVSDVVRALSSYSEDPTFSAAMDAAREKQKSSQEDFVSLFGESWTELAKGKKLASVFYTLENKD